MTGNPTHRNYCIVCPSTEMSHSMDELMTQESRDTGIDMSFSVDSLRTAVTSQAHYMEHSGAARYDPSHDCHMIVTCFSLSHMSVGLCKILVVSQSAILEMETLKEPKFLTQSPGKMVRV